MPGPPPVDVRRETVVLPTYEPRRPDPNPMFLEKRVYQGSSGRVYPLPCTDRIAEKSAARSWEAVFIENEFIRVMILPALGGRIHRIQDKTNNFDAIYHQPVIKPALVGLAGPWCSGGIEFNWPQHHRPSTFLPTDVAIERHDDGGATVWLSEHDPMARMKGMHGVCLHPARSYVELRVRAYNRTPDVQTFLWWANVAIRVHEEYQSFFPPDVTCVADHARRAMSSFPRCSGHYYGVDYMARARRGIQSSEMPRQFVPPHCRRDSEIENHKSKIDNFPPDDLTWYANIPVPTSYMGLGSSEDFLGGYDHRARAGLVHVASHHLAPGKKQWTWGNHEFGYAWDRNLTDADSSGEYAPYIELMAGVYTDNQPDFSFLQPGETRTWSQFWYPIREIGPAQHATAEGAISLRLVPGRARIGVAVTSIHPTATVQLERRGRIVARWTQRLAPDQPFVAETRFAARGPATDITARVLAADGRELLAYTPQEPTHGKLPPAIEPPAPAAMRHSDELHLAGLHLEQYRHATRMPEDYWREALRRDPGDARCNLALGRWHLRHGEFEAAELHLRASVARLTQHNPNPSDGEAYYQLGLCLRHQAFAATRPSPARRRSPTARPAGNTMSATRSSRASVTAHVEFEGLHPPQLALFPDLRKLTEAYTAFYKATWNHAWQAASFHALAEIDALRGHWETALDHLARALRVNADNLRARNLQVIALRRLGRTTEADSLLQATLALDPLDWWARHLNGEPLTCDDQVRLDLAHDCARAGLFCEALTVLDGAILARPPPREVAKRPAGSPDASATFPARIETPQPSPPAVALPDASLGAAPLVHYTRAWLCHIICDKRAVASHLTAAARADPAYCFPARLEEIAILEFAIRMRPRDSRAPFFLGHLLYDRRRHREAIRHWERAVALAAGNAVAWRNLGIGYFNILRQPGKARAAYDRAFRANPADARLLYERDQLWKRLGVAPARRLRELLRHPALVQQRDDLTVELCALYNQTGRSAAARPIITGRKFQPWEGGEGQALGQYVRTHLALGRHALAANRPLDAISCFSAALVAPENLGEAKHLLANQSDIHYWLGCACAARGFRAAARQLWTVAATARGDFQEMSVRTFSEMTFYSALALDQLGRKADARKLLRGLLSYAQKLSRTPAKIDYFATSLPTLLLFDDNLQARQQTTALVLEAQARLGSGQARTARNLLRAVLRRDPSHALAADLLAGTYPGVPHIESRTRVRPTRPRTPPPTP